MLFLTLLATVLAAVSVRAQSKNTLYTNTVSYCAEARAVLVDSFDIAYHRANQSATFSFSAASVENNLNLIANLYVNVYGIEAINQTLNLCDFVQGVLCPLPMVNFTGYGTYPIPASITKDIPSIAWSVPNLEGYARVTLTSVDTGETEACLQATLANGWSTRIPAVAWSTSMFTLAALLLALVHTVLTNSPSPAQYRFFDILFLFQTAASTGFLRLNYPLMYTAFVQNFHWAMGLFSAGKMQDSINDMRRRTGGEQDGTAYNTVQYINRKLSPYNTFTRVNFNELVANAATFKSYVATLPSSLSLNTFSKRVDVTAQADTSDISTGLPVYVNTLNIPEVNAFPTVFLIFLISIAVAIAFHVLLFATVFFVARVGKGGRGTNWAGRLRKGYGMFSIGNALRMCLIWFFPIFIFAFYQFRIGKSDSWLSILLAVIAILIVLVPLVTVFVLSVLCHRRESPTAPSISPLYTSYRFFNSVGVLYRAYRQRYHFFWFAPLTLAMIAKAGFITFGHRNAWAQVIGLMVVEAITFVCIVGFRPHKDRKGDWLAAFLSFCRLAAFGLLVAFIESVGVKPIPRTIIGFVIIVLFGIPAVLLFFGFFWNLGYGYLWRRHTHRIEDGLEVERFAASDDEHDSQRPAMTQIDFPAHAVFTNQDGGFVTPTRQRESSVMEPVGNNTYEAYPDQSQSQSHLAQDAYAHAGGIAPDAYTSDAASRRTSGYSTYYTPSGLPQGTNNEYFAGNGNGAAQRY